MQFLALSLFLIIFSFCKGINWFYLLFYIGRKMLCREEIYVHVRDFTDGDDTNISKIEHAIAFLGWHHLYMYFCVFVSLFVCLSVCLSVQLKIDSLHRSQYQLSVPLPPPVNTEYYGYQMSTPLLFVITYYIKDCIMSVPLSLKKKQ